MAGRISTNNGRGYLLPLACLFTLVLAVYGPFLIGHSRLSGVDTEHLSPWAESTTEHPQVALGVAADKTLMFHPQLQVAIDRSLKGEIPHWNPHNLAGVPLLAQAVHGWLHWANFPAWAMPAQEAYGWIAAVQACLAAIFTYLLARRLGVDTLPASLAGLVFAFGGYMAVRVHWYQIQGASLYLPLVLLSVDSLFRRGGGGAVAALAAGVGASWLAGFPQGTLHLLYAAAIWTGVRTASRLRTRPAAEGCQPALLVTLGLMLGLALGAPQWLPSAYLASSGTTSRTSASPEEVRSLGMEPASLISLALPDFFPHPTRLSDHPSPLLRERGALRLLFEKPGTNHIETASTISLAGLLLALFGMSRPARGRGLGMALFIAGGALCLDTPLAAWAAKLPGLDTGDPRRFLLLLGMGGAILAALGLQRLLHTGPSRGLKKLCSAVALTLIVATGVSHGISGEAWEGFLLPALADRLGFSLAEAQEYGTTLQFDLELLQSALLHSAILATVIAGVVLLATSKRHRILAGLSLVAIAAFDLTTHVVQPNTTGVEGLLSRVPPGLEWMRDDEGGRLVRFHPSPEGTTSRQPLTYPFPPNIGLGHRISELSGYITMAPRRLENWHEILQPGSRSGVGMTPLADPSTLGSPLLDRAAVSRVISSTKLTHPSLTLLGETPGTWFYQRDTALPRARITYDWIAVESEAAAEEWLRNNPRSTATVLENWEEILPSQYNRDEKNSAVIVTDLPEQVEIQVAGVSQGGVLILSDSIMPGWTAWVDGVPTPILPADLAFRGVPVPPGDHHIVFQYVTPGWTEGRALGFMGLLGLAACLVWHKRQRKARH